MGAHHGGSQHDNLCYTSGLGADACLARRIAFSFAEPFLLAYVHAFNKAI